MNETNLTFIDNEWALIIAHRDSNSIILYSSMIAFEDAYNLGIDVFETDVRITEDFVPIIFHEKQDLLLKRMNIICYD